MEILRYIVFIGLLFSVSEIKAQDYFYKKYSSSVFDTGNGIVELPNGDYAITGSSGAFDENSSQAFLMIVDSQGEWKWTKAYGGDGDEVGVRVMHLPGDGFLIAGYTNSTPERDYNFILYKTDEDGELQWEKQYGGDNWEILRDAALLPDGGVILVGQTEGQTTNDIDGFMVRTDAQGDTLWTKVLSTPQPDIIYGIDLVSATDFLISGDYGNDGETAGMIASFDIDGSQNWMEFYNDQGPSTIRAVKSFNGRIYGLGGIWLNEEDHYKWGFEALGDGEFLASFNGTQEASSMFTAFAIRDMESMFVAYTTDAPIDDPYSHGYDALVMKFYTAMYYNDLGLRFSEKGDDIINEVIVASDGGITMIGTCSDYVPGGDLNFMGTNLMVMKISATDEYQDMVDEEPGVFVGLVEEKSYDFIVHPNPTLDNILIPLMLVDMPFTLTDIQGQVVQQGVLSSSLDLSMYTAGVYFLSVSDGTNIRQSKIIKR